MKSGAGTVVAALASALLLSGCLSSRSFVEPAYANTKYEDLVVVNNVADHGAARSKGFKTGLSLGGAGTLRRLVLEG